MFKARSAAESMSGLMSRLRSTSTSGGSSTLGLNETLDDLDLRELLLFWY